METYKVKSFPLLHRAVSRISLQSAKLGYSPPAPTPEHLMLAASQVTGKDDWGPDFPYEALHRLFESYRSEANFSMKGRHEFEKLLVERLINRLEIQDAVRNFPDISERRTHRPLFITGMPRTVTTILHRLMALDPTRRTLKFWETLEPLPASPTRRPEDRPKNQRVRTTASKTVSLFKIHEGNPHGIRNSPIGVHRAADEFPVGFIFQSIRETSQFLKVATGSGYESDVSVSLPSA